MGDSEKKLGASLLKKNEFTLIVFGALLLTLIVFFLFFRSSGSKTEPVTQTASGDSFATLEKRITDLEQAIAGLQAKGLTAPGDSTEKSPAMDLVKDRVTRLETAFSVKFDSLIDRMGAIEKSISLLKSPPAGTVIKTMQPTATPPVKKAVKKQKDAAMFHTVEKGETLYSISKKYKTSVASLRKLNNLSATATIYPGNNILVR